MAVLLLAEVTGGQLSVDATAKTIAATRSLGDITVLCAGAACGGAAEAAAKLDGVAKVLRYAKRHRVGHIVFVIDSTGVSSVDDAIEIYKLLGKYKNKLTYHAIVRDCIGPGLVVAVILVAFTTTTPSIGNSILWGAVIIGVLR